MLSSLSRRFPPGFRAPLLILVLGAALPGLLLAGVLVWRTAEANRVVIEHRLMDAARVDAAALDRELEGTIRALEVLATSPSLDTNDLPAFYVRAQRAQAAEPTWYMILLVRPDGMRLLNTRAPLDAPPTPVVERASLDELLATGRPVVGRVKRLGDEGSTYLFPVRVPVVRDGKLRYVLTAVVDTASLAHLVRSDLPASEQWTRGIIDPAGTIAARTRDAARFVGRPATGPAVERMKREPGHEADVFRSDTVEGKQVYAVLARSTFGWFSAVSVPLDVLDGPARGSMVAFGIAAASLLLCGLWPVVMIARGLVRRAETARLEAEGARQVAEEASRTKDEFLALLGHELRNPLAPAMTALALIRRRDEGAFRREREILERQIRHMARLVDDLLDVSRLGRGKIELRLGAVALAGAVARAVDMAAPLVAERGHTLTVDVPEGLRLEADEDRLVQILGNLLQNAAKYTPPGGHLSLRARASGAHVTIEVEDDGPGVAPDLLPVLFEPFVQGPRSIDRQQGGLGLGLAVARKLTELHGGAVTHESRAPERGSRFVVRLPPSNLIAG